jgi:hypothetical protein
MSGKITGWVLTHGPADRALRAVLVVLADGARNDSGLVSMSLAKIAERSLFALSTASVQVNRLIDAGWIERVEDGYPGRPAVYRVLGPHLVENPNVLRSGPNNVVRSGPNESFGLDRTTSFGLGRTTVRNTGSYGSNGRGASAPIASSGRRLSPAEKRARAACPTCNRNGQVELEDGSVARCDHSPASGPREVPDGF